MSKQSEAKLKQGYQPKPIHPACGNCQFFSSSMVEGTGYFGGYTEEKNMRCTLGGFAVGKSATCRQHQYKA